MINTEKTNNVELKGFVKTKPELSHSVLGESFYEFLLEVPRLSKDSDYIPITISEKILPSNIGLGKEIGIIGQFRSYNKLIDGKSKLMLTVFVRDLVNPMVINNINSVEIEGFICKEPIYRTTPFGREIADILVAVNRNYNKSDYLPCIAWGRNARFASELQVGGKIVIKGRIQSREYQKKIDEEIFETRMAYEISISYLNVYNENEDDYFIKQNLLSPVTN